MIKDNKQQGFIALFFILGISFTFLTWISLSSKRVFDYVYIKESFYKNRDLLHNHILCADIFANIFIQSKGNFYQSENTFIRNSYYKDGFICNVENINTIYENGSIDKLLFIIDNYGFEYKFKNGFVEYYKSFNLI